MVHHTASPPSTDGNTDIQFILHGAPYSPICNLYLDRKGTFHVIAAGRTATNGEGHDSWGGGVPQDMMNFYAISIEAANNGVGEKWPVAQTSNYVKGVAALCAAYKIPVAHVRAHAEWSPGRKIDPAGPSPWSADAHTWNMNAFRSSVTVAMGLHPATPHPSIGIFDPVHFQWGLFPLDVHKATIQLNSNGDLVRYLQGVLTKTKFYSAAIDGFFGNVTAQAVKAFQANKGLVVDGVVGPQTWAAIDKAS
jgi:N-acetyl-anhydromuramyl-L-alanine amidase AmpD